MNYTIDYHRLVAGDLKYIDDILTEHAGPVIADQKAVLTVDGIYSLSALPHIGARRWMLRGHEYRVKAAGKAVIVFTVDDENREVFIVAVTYGGMDWLTRTVSRLD